jgi:predicted metal-binding membrane protein
MPVVAAAPKKEAPGSAFAVLSWRIELAVVVAMIALSVLAWWSTVDQAVSMRGMAMGLGQIGGRGQGDMSVGVFLAMWVTMMVAMMLPTALPMVFAHLAVTRRRGRGVYLTIVFIAGYLLVWSAIGVVPLIAFKALAGLSGDAIQSNWLPALAGAILIAAGAYQFTGWKQFCLDKCQSPFAFIVAHEVGSAPSSLRAGAIHGALCLGCCWALTAVLLVVGLMNLIWMAALFALFFVEKSWRHGLVVAKIAGVVVMVLGASVIVRPALLPLISL